MNLGSYTIQSASARRKPCTLRKMIHSPERVKAIRDSAAAYAQSVADLKVQVKDPYLRGQLQQIRKWLNDLERFFLGSLSHESRTPEQESAWLGNAETFLQKAVLPQLKSIQDAVAKYGPNTNSAG